MNKEIRIKIYKIMDLCLDAKELGHDCFLSFQAHINAFEMQVYLYGWRTGADPEYRSQVSLKHGNIEDILEKFDGIINYLENINNLNEKEIKLQDMKAKFNSIMKYGPSNLRDYDLSCLMTKMEELFSIPAFNDEKFNQENADVMELYKSVSNERSFVKNLKIV